MWPLALLSALLTGLGSGSATAPGPHPGPERKVDLLPYAQTGPEAQVGPEESRYQVFLLTMDQGDEVWERFGHNALVIRDLEEGRDLAWNWGLFDFEDVDFIPRFLRGTMLYRMGPSEVDPLVNAYVASNRSVYANEVFLTQEEARQLDEFVQWNYQPENRAYVYHYYLDNCSTRIRDVLDLVLGGLLQETFADTETPYSFRWHSRRLVQETLWVDQGLSFLLGMRGDPPRTEWESMFVPMELMQLLEGVERPDGAGGSTPLLGPREVLFSADREPAPVSPTGFSPLWILLGLVGAAAFTALAPAGSAAHRWRLAFLGLVVGGWGLASAALGGILAMAWFTDHEFIHWNLNILYMNPLGLLLAAVGLPVLLHQGWRTGAPGRMAARLAVLIAGLSLATALLQLTPLLHQGNAEVVAVALPINLSVAWALLRVTGSLAR